MHFLLFQFAGRNFIPFEDLFFSEGYPDYQKVYHSVSPAQVKTICNHKGEFWISLWLLNCVVLDTIDITKTRLLNSYILIPEINGNLAFKYSEEKVLMWLKIKTTALQNFIMTSGVRIPLHKTANFKASSSISAANIDKGGLI